MLPPDPTAGARDGQAATNQGTGVASSPPAMELPHLDEIAESVRDGQCILFLGAGVHYPPPQGSTYSYPADQRPPLGKALSRHLANSYRLLAQHAGEAGKPRISPLWVSEVA